MSPLQIHPQTKAAYRLYHDGILAFARAEQVGMRIDIDYCERKKSLLTNKISRLERKIRDSKFGRHWGHSVKGAINFNSNPQLSHFLYTVKKLVPTKTTATGGKGSTDDEALSALGIPELEWLLEMRKLRKIRDTYLDAFVREQVKGVIHPFFNLHLVRTYRSSSDRPNFQNIPKRDKEAMVLCRTAILPRLGHRFFSVDFSGIEVRMAGCYTQDAKLIYDILHGDMHKDMAVELYMLETLDKHDAGEGNLRQGGKNGFVFPQFYGDYYGNCAPNLIRWAAMGKLKDGTPALVHLKDKGLVVLNKDGSVRNHDKFTEHVKHVEDLFWRERYSGYNEWKNKTWADYQQCGYIDMHTGFRCSGLMSRNDVTNYAFQGSAFHCLLWTFIETDRLIMEERLKSRLVSQVHDEATADTAPEETMFLGCEMRRIATQALPQAWDWITVPLEVEADICGINRPWAEKEFCPLP